MARTNRRKDIPNQQQLWNQQHAVRGVSGIEGDSLKFAPNQSAVLFEQKLPAGSTILEVGSANGRDARYWASKGHEVVALDFSEVALDQLQQLAVAQQVNELIIPIVWDIADGKLPLNKMPKNITGFYARSALHVGDKQMYVLGQEVNSVLQAGGKVFIEGKGNKDPKIARSKKIGNGLAVDQEENGHLRRIWHPEFVNKLCAAVGWDILELNTSTEDWNGTQALFLSLLAQKG